MNFKIQKIKDCCCIEQPSKSSNSSNSSNSKEDAICNAIGLTNSGLLRAIAQNPGLRDCCQLLANQAIEYINNPKTSTCNILIAGNVAYGLLFGVARNPSQQDELILVANNAFPNGDTPFTPCILPP